MTPRGRRRFRAGTALTTIADSDAGSDAGTDATGGVGTDLRAVVASVPIFADTTPEFVDALVAGLEMRKYADGELIMKEGDVGDDMYILSSGEVEIVVGEDETVVARLGPGKFFGELALLKDAKRNATVRAAAPLDDPHAQGHVVEAARLSKEAFHSVIEENPGVLDQITAIAFGRDRAKEVVRKVPIFKDCDDTFLDLLVRKLKPEVLKEGDFVMREGDTGSEMYILYKGEVEVIAGAENKVLAKLGEGAFFGEIALLKNARRNASIRALVQCETFVLSKVDFDAALADYPDYRELILAVANEKAARREESLLPLHLAVRSGLVEEVDRVIKDHLSKNTEKEQVNIKDEVGWTALHEAAHSGFDNVVTHLVKLGANVNEMNKEGSTPLHLAAASGHVEATDALITAGADLKAMNEDGSTPLHLAGRCGEIEVARKILERGGNVETVDVNGNIPLHLACNVGHADMARFLIGAGSNVNKANAKGVVPLHDAALSDSGEVVKVLTDAGAVVDAADEELATPLQYAGNNGAANAARELCAKGADCGFRDYNGHIPLHHAAFDGTRECVDVLLQYKSNIRTKGEDGNVPYVFAQMAGNDEIAELLYFEEDPLIIAVREGDYDTVDTLLAQGHDANGCHPDDGWTAMHEAAARGDVAMISLLADRNARVHITSTDGMTPLHMAAGAGGADATETLLDIAQRQCEADESGETDMLTVLDSKNGVGRTALHIAAKSGDMDNVALLLSSGCDHDAKDSYGRTAKDYALKSGAVKDWDALVEQFAPKPSVIEACRTSDLAMLKRTIATAEKNGTLEEELARTRADGDEELNEDELMTPMQWAAALGFGKGIDLLLEKGAKPDEPQGAFGYAPIHLAARGGTEETCEAAIKLLDAGADPNRETSDGAGSVMAHVAPTDENMPLVEALIAKGANVDAVGGGDNESLLHVAALRGNVALVAALVAAGANPRAKNVSGLNPHDLALQGPEAEVIAPLVADPHGACRDGDHLALKAVLIDHKTVEPDLLVHGDERLQTPLHVASETGSVACVKVTLEALKKSKKEDGTSKLEDNLNAYDNQALTPLHQAVLSRHPRVVEKLIAAGADPNTVTGEGEVPPDPNAPPGSTALHIAARTNDPDTVHALFSGSDAAATGHSDGDNGDGSGGEGSGGEGTGGGVTIAPAPHPEAADADNKTALELAESLGHEEAARAIREAFAGNMSPEEATEALLAAAREGEASATRRALGKKADAAAVDPSTGANALGLIARSRPRREGDHRGGGGGSGGADGGGGGGGGVDGDGQPVGDGDGGSGDGANNAAEDDDAPVAYSATAGAIPAAEAILGSRAFTDDPSLKNHRDTAGDTPILSAARVGDMGMVTFLAGDSDVDVDASNPSDGKTALMLAAALGDADAVQALLKAGANPEAVDADGCTALHAATEAGSVGCVRALLETGRVDPNARDAKGRSALHAAAERGDADLVRELLRGGADPNAVDAEGRTALMLAAQMGDQDVVDALIAGGADTNLRDNEGMTALAHASQRGDSAMVESLLAAGADPVDYVSTAIRSGDMAAINAVLDRGGFDPNATTASGEPLLTACVAAGDLETLNRLLAMGADPNGKDSEGRTPLHHACAGDTEQSLAMAEALLGKGASIDAEDDKGRTPLHDVAETGSVEACRVVIEKAGEKASRARAVKGTMRTGDDTETALTPRQIAEKLGREDVASALSSGDDKALLAAVRDGDEAAIAALAASGVNLDNHGPDGTTPLMEAVKMGSFSAVRALLTAGAKPNIRSKDGKDLTALALVPMSTATGAPRPVTSSGSRGGATSSAKKTSSSNLPRPGGAAGAGAGAGGGDDDSASTSTSTGAAIVQLMALHGADMSAADSHGQTPLHHAMLRSRADCARALVTAGADANARDADGMTPLMIGTGRGGFKAAAEIVRRSRDVDLDAKANADEKGKGHSGEGKKDGAGTDKDHAGDTDASAGAHGSSKGGRSTVSQSRQGMTAYEMATACGDEPYAAVVTGPSALIELIRRGDVSRIKRLLEAGAYPRGTAPDGDTALHVSAESTGLEAVTKMLIARGADPDARDAEGRTPLHRACLPKASGHNRANAEALLTYGADPTRTDPLGRAPLHTASGNDACAPCLASLLVRMRPVPANDNASNSDNGGDNGGDKTGENGENGEKSDGEKNGGSAEKQTLNPADMPDAMGRRPLHHAAEAGALSCIRLLLRAGADRTLTDSDGKTPLQVAQETWGEDSAQSKGASTAAAAGGGDGENKSQTNDEQSKATTDGGDDADAKNTDSSNNGNDNNTTTGDTDGGGDGDGKKSAGGDDEHATETEAEKKARADKRTAHGKAVIEALRDPASEGEVRKLHAAISQCDRETAEQILNAGTGGTTVASTDNSGRASLHVAAASKSRPMVDFVLEKGGDVGQRDHAGATPLHVASRVDSAAVVSRLLEKGADPSALDEQRRTPVHHACASNCPSALTVLLTHLSAKDKEKAKGENRGGDSGAGKGGSSNNNGVNPALFSARDAHGLTPLHLCAVTGSQACARQLLDRGAARSLCDKEGKTPFDLAVAQGHTRLAVLLADACQLVAVGTPADLARALEKGEDPSGTNQSAGGPSPLHVCAELNRVDHARVLLEAGALVDATDSSGDTALHVACRLSHDDVAVLLIRGGASLSMTDRHGCTASHLASGSGAHVTLRELMRHEADPTAGDMNRAQPLHYCGMSGSAECIRALLNHGASVRARRRDGLQPYDIAVKNGHLAAAEMLDPDGPYALGYGEPQRVAGRRYLVQPGRSRHHPAPPSTPRSIDRPLTLSSSLKVPYGGEVTPSGSPRKPLPPATPTNGYGSTGKGTQSMSPRPGSTTRRSGKSPRGHPRGCDCGSCMGTSLPPIHHQRGSATSTTTTTVSASARADREFLYEYKDGCCVRSRPSDKKTQYARLLRFDKDGRVADCPLCGRVEVPMVRRHCRTCGKHSWTVECFGCGSVLTGFPPLMALE